MLKNPLSIQLGQYIRGQEINDWCKYQIMNGGSHYKYAKFLLSKKYKNNVWYKKIYKDETSSTPNFYTIVFQKI